MPIDLFALETIRSRAEACNACGLRSYRNELVFADGDGSQKIMLIGEAPGVEEDLTGIPFVGPAGQLLNELFLEAGINRRDIYICNVLKCRPINNASPTVAQATSCRVFLLRQIQLIQPELIISMGNPASQLLLAGVFANGKVPGITQIRGQEYETPGGRIVFPVFHTAYILRDMSKMDIMKEDMQEIARRYRRIYNLKEMGS